MLHYDKIKDRLTRGERAFGPKAKDYKQEVMNYLCSRIAEGANLNELIPLRSKVLPTLATFLEWTVDPEYKQLYNQSERVRRVRLSERFLGSLKEYTAKPTAQNAEIVKAHHKALDMLEKSGVDTDTVHITVKSNLPDNFWDKA